MGPIPGVVLLEKLMDQYKCPEQGPDKAHQLLGKIPHGCFLGVTQLCIPKCQGFGLCSRGLGTFPKDPVHISLKADSNPGEVSCDTLKRKAAYKEGW